MRKSNSKYKERKQDELHERTPWNSKQDNARKNGLTPTLDSRFKSCVQGGENSIVEQSCCLPSYLPGSFVDSRLRRLASEREW